MVKIGSESAHKKPIPMFLRIYGREKLYLQ